MSLLLATKKAQQRLLKAEKVAFPRVAPRCQYVGTCGGCNLQDLAYEHQLLLKQQFVDQAFRPLGATCAPVAPLDDPWRYRNKIELSFGRARESTALGLHAAGSFWKVVDIEDCWLVPDAFAPVIATVREAVRRSGLPTYDVKAHHGFWRHVIVRVSRENQQLMLCVITAEGPREAVDQLASLVTQQHPEVATCYWGIRRGVADVAVPDELHLLSGPPYLRERIGPFEVDLHPLTFIQPCLAQAERLYDTIVQWARARQVASAWDLYAGIGCIGMYLSQVATTVRCLESDAQNIAGLQRNVELNGLTNLSVYPGQVETHLKYLEPSPPPDLVVVDPPRAGLHKYALRALAAVQPRLLCYVSCNLATLIPNLHALLALCPTYRLALVQAFDMFPQTTHLETLVLLERPSA